MCFQVCTIREVRHLASYLWVVQSAGMILRSLSTLNTARGESTSSNSWSLRYDIEGRPQSSSNRARGPYLGHASWQMYRYVFFLFFLYVEGIKFLWRRVRRWGPNSTGPGSHRFSLQPGPVPVMKLALACCGSTRNPWRSVVILSCRLPMQTLKWPAPLDRTCQYDSFCCPASILAMFSNAPDWVMQSFSACQTSGILIYSSSAVP